MSHCLVLHIVECLSLLVDEVRVYPLILTHVTSKPVTILGDVPGTVLPAVGPLAAQPPVVSLIIGHTAPQPAPHCDIRGRTIRTLPAEGIVLYNATSVPRPLVVEGEAAAVGIDESELLHVACLTLIEGGRVGRLAALLSGG